MLIFIFCAMSFAIEYQIGRLREQKRLRDMMKQSDGWNNGR